MAKRTAPIALRTPPKSRSKSAAKPAPSGWAAAAKRARAVADEEAKLSEIGRKRLAMAAAWAAAEREKVGPPAGWKAAAERAERQRAADKEAARKERARLARQAKAAERRPPEPWEEPKPETWPQAAARVKRQAAQAARDLRNTKRLAAQVAREEKRDRQRLVEAEAEVLRVLEAQRATRGERRMQEQADRAMSRMRGIERRHPGSIEQYNAIQAWLDKIFPGAVVEIEADGSVNGLLKIPQADEPGLLLDLMNDRQGDAPIGTWTRIGWEFRIAPHHAKVEQEPSSAELEALLYGPPGYHRYDGKFVAVVCTPWYPPDNIAQAIITAADDDAAAHGSIHGNMTAPEYGHKAMAAVIECHYNPEGEKPDRT